MSRARLLLLHATRLFAGRVKEKSSQLQRESQEMGMVHTPPLLHWEPMLAVMVFVLLVLCLLLHVTPLFAGRVKETSSQLRRECHEIEMVHAPRSTPHSMLQRS